MKQTLATLDLREKPGQRVSYFRYVRHFRQVGPIDLARGERVFSAGPHHDFYSVMVETEEPPASADGSPNSN
jgi:hypothetical protein